ncbi:hypothetical protein GCM10010170_022910 [Dactylosporangium salmoneum]|uniref:Uncharacterized protein n=1 Tax=Dactylosporangium salmoneum TaxID=53361 RepID=A0ABP5SW93_9ACTN
MGHDVGKDAGPAAGWDAWPDPPPYQESHRWTRPAPDPSPPLTDAEANGAVTAPPTRSAPVSTVIAVNRRDPTRFKLATEHSSTKTDHVR